MAGPYGRLVVWRSVHTPAKRHSRPSPHHQSRALCAFVLSLPVFLEWWFGRIPKSEKKILSVALLLREGFSASFSFCRG